MPVYKFRHYRRLDPENSGVETRITDQEFHADSKEQALSIKDGLAEGFNSGTDFAELLADDGTVIWQKGYHA